MLPSSVAPPISAEGEEEEFEYEYVEDEGGVGNTRSSYLV